MGKRTKFIGFLESLTTSSNNELMESVKKGYKACFESESVQDYKVLKTYEIVTPEDAEFGEPGERGYADDRGNHYTSDEDNEGLNLIMTLIRPEEDQDIISATVEYLSDNQAYNFNGSDSFSDNGEDEDYRTGARTTYTYHLQNYNEQEIAAIVNALN